MPVHRWFVWITIGVILSGMEVRGRRMRRMPAADRRAG